MGLYAIDCTKCGTPFMWFSGCLDQRCGDCMAGQDVEGEEKEFEVIMTVTGRASALVKAKSKAEAKLKAHKMEFVENSDELIEWEWNEIETVKE